VPDKKSKKKKRIGPEMPIKIDDMVRVTRTNRIHPGCWWVGKARKK
jgi:hypothetical protein